MDAVKYLKEIERICDSFPVEAACEGCPLFSENHSCLMYDPESVPIVEQWSEEHPQKTRKSDFLDKYPNAEVGDDGIPNLCCSRLGYVKNCPRNKDCADCWNEPLEDENNEN